MGTYVYRNIVPALNGGVNNEDSSHLGTTKGKKSCRTKGMYYVIVTANRRGTMKSQLCGLCSRLMRSTCFSLNPILSNAPLSTFKSLCPRLLHPLIHSDRVNAMDNSQPNSGAFQTFEDVPLTPLHDQSQSANTSGGFSHTPLEHEIVASESVWDDSGISDGLIEQQIVISNGLSGKGSPAALASDTRECSPNVVVGQADFASDVLGDPDSEEAIPKSAVLEPHSGLADLSPSGIESAVTLVETILALDTESRPTNAVNKTSFSTDSPTEQSAGPPISETDTNLEIRRSSEHVDRSNGPNEPAISIPPAMVVAQATFRRIERREPSTPSSIPEYFDIPIPIFPFPAGTSRCKNRNCPIKIRHERGPYLHGGKLRTREGSIFGSSNPPPEIWFLYDRSGNGGFRGNGDTTFAPVELFVKYHFGETRGECILASKVAGGDVQQGVEPGGKKLRSWRFWS